MNIQNWPIDKIMQLPDCVFGRRWEIIFAHNFIAPAVEYRISDLGLPDVCVLWEIHTWQQEITTGAAGIWAYSSLALGDQLPATAAEFLSLESLLSGCQEVVAGVEIIRGVMHLTKLRKPVEAQGRRVVVSMTSVQAGAFDIGIGLVFSSLPKEVPDWLISGPGSGL